MHGAVAHQHAADHRVRRRGAGAQLGQLERAAAGTAIVRPGSIATTPAAAAASDASQLAVGVARAPASRRSADPATRMFAPARCTSAMVARPDAAVDLDLHGLCRALGQLAHARQPVERGRDERLAAPAGVDAHAQQHVGVPRRLARAPPPAWPGSASRRPGSRARGSACSVRCRCGQVSTCTVMLSAPAAANWSMCRSGCSIIRCTSAKPPRSWISVGDVGHHLRPEGDHGDEVAVHHVDVDHPGAGVQHLAHLFAHAAEVRRQDRRSHLDRRGPLAHGWSG